jgi:isoquinoline 1-oxidoreductase/isoquinoline 1-oxidoreductase beta subunit
MPGISRRVILLGSAAVAGGGLVLGWLLPGGSRQRLAADATILEPNAYLQITPAGDIILQVDKSEIGQGVMTGFVTLLAEELDVPPARITPRHAPVHPLFQDPVQLTGESKSMATRWRPIRETGAAARLMLMQAAAARWKVSTDEVGTDGSGGVVRLASGDRYEYRELAAEASRLAVPRRVSVRSPGQFRYIGRSVPRTDAPAKVTGRALYGIDTRLPGLVVAVIARPPRLRAVLRKHDATATRQLPGVIDAFVVHAGVAVLADSYWHARRGADALVVEWEDGPLAGIDDAAIRDGQAAVLDRDRGHRVRDDGDAAAAIASAVRIVEAEFHLPYLAHATMEPMNATIWFHDGGCEAWVPNQGPDMVRQVICDMSGLPRERVIVHTTYAGGGFGRRATMEYVVEAAVIALRADRPVKLVWSREDDMRHGLFREATLHRMRAGLDGGGEVVGWEHRLVAAALNGLVIPVALSVMAPEWLPRPAVQGAAGLITRAADRYAGSFAARAAADGMAYSLPNVAVDVCQWNPGVPVTIWRSVGYSYAGFVIESFVDELAAASGQDPAAWRRRHLKGRPRHLRVLDELLAHAGWGRPLAAGRYHGMALQEAFGTVVGQVAEVSIASDGVIRVHRVTCVVDCGTAVNPDIVSQQMEGGIIFGLSAALYGEIHLDDGAIREGNFHDYPLVRMADSPDIDVHIVASDAEPSGVGEAGVPPIAAAVANAVHAATGRRLRSLPLRLQA